MPLLVWHVSCIHILIQGFAGIMVIRTAAAIFMILVLFLTGPVIQLALAAAPEGSPVVSGKLKGDFARITFTWPEKVKFRTAMSGNVLTITFEKPINSSPGSALAGLAPYIEKAVLSADKKSVAITMNQPYPVRSFVSGTAGGVDVLKVTNRPLAQEPTTATAPTPAPAPQTKPQQIAQKAPPAPQPAPKPAVPVAKTEEAKPQPAPIQPAAPVPVAKEPAKEVAAPAPAPEKAPETKPVETAKPEVAAAVEKPIETPVIAEKPAEKPATPEKLEVAENPIKASFPLPIAKPQPPQTATEKSTAADKKEEKPAATASTSAAKEQVVATEAKGKQMVVTIHQQNVNADFYFPWKERVASAVFTRGPYLWVVFDKPTEINLTSLGSILPSYISSVERMEYAGNTVLRFKTSSPVFASARHRRDSYEWIISVSRRSRIPPAPILVEPRTQPPLKPHILVTVLQTSPSLQITDPTLGDVLEVIPTHAEGNGVYPERNFLEFSLLRTAQGVVVKKIHENVSVAKLRNGLRITRPGEGIMISSNLPPLDLASVMEAEANANTFFPYELWKVENADEFFRRKQQLQREIIHANDQKASELRMQLAQLYLGQGMYLEALGMLNIIKAGDPNFYEVYQLAALRGAANFMMDRIMEANLDFADASLEGEEEIELWKRSTAVMMGDEKKLTQFLKYDPQFISHYPPKIRQKLAIIAADQLIGRKRYSAFSQVIGALKKNEQLADISDQVDYMIGRMHADSGNTEEAMKVFQRVIENSKNRFVQVRAEFALATLEYETGAIDRRALVDKLDRLRYIWRGDALELGVLNLLGDLNALEGRYPQALRAWKDIMVNFPGAPNAAAVATKMADAFVQLFNEGKADELEPLEALALYYEFRDLTPIGKQGDRMIQNLADRLASVDLLDRAAALLSHQVKYRLEKEERSRVGTRLGLIYLLNREPRKTLEVLQLTGYGAGEEGLNRQRNHLAAMAYSDIGEWKTALDMLKDDYSEEAKMIRLDVFWENKDWKNVITTAEDILASRRDITAPLNETEAQTLVRLAVGYTFEGDTLQLQYLRDYFTPLMAGNNLKDRFLFISNDTGPIDPKNMATLEKEITDIKSFLDTYRSQVQEKGLSSIN